MLSVFGLGFVVSKVVCYQTCCPILKKGEIQFQRPNTRTIEDPMIITRFFYASHDNSGAWCCKSPRMRWFEEWKRNVHRAAERHQTLHVFYFEGGKGKGYLTDFLALDWKFFKNGTHRAGVQMKSI